MAKKYKPLRDMVLVEVPDRSKTESGIYIPDQAKGKPTEGTVKAIGKDVAELKVGDKVLFVKHGQTEVGGDILISEEDILAIIL